MKWKVRSVVSAHGLWVLIYAAYDKIPSYFPCGVTELFMYYFDSESLTSQSSICQAFLELTLENYICIVFSFNFRFSGSGPKHGTQNVFHIWNSNKVMSEYSSRLYSISEAGCVMEC